MSCLVHFGTMTVLPPNSFLDYTRTVPLLVCTGWKKESEMVATRSVTCVEATTQGPSFALRKGEPINASVDSKLPLV